MRKLFKYLILGSAIFICPMFVLAASETTISKDNPSVGDTIYLYTNNNTLEVKVLSVTPTISVTPTTSVAPVAETNTPANTSFLPTNLQASLDSFATEIP